MSDDYTPTTERVRSEYARDTNATVKHGVPRAEFDRWLRSVQAEAWDEGAEATALRIPEGVWHEVAAPRTPNPYRTETRK